MAAFLGNLFWFSTITSLLTLVVIMGMPPARNRFPLGQIVIAMVMTLILVGPGWFDPMHDGPAVWVFVLQLIVAGAIIGLTNRAIIGIGENLDRLSDDADPGP